MNNFIPLTLCLTVALGLSGCGKSEEPAEEAAAPATGAVEEPRSGAEKAMDAVGDMGREAGEAASGAADSVMVEGGEMAEAAMEQGADLAAAAKEKAEELIAKVKQYIADNDLDLASQAMEQLRQLKDSLPESMQATIDQLEQMLSGAESGTAPSPGQ